MDSFGAVFSALSDVTAALNISASRCAALRAFCASFLAAFSLANFSALISSCLARAAAFAAAFSAATRSCSSRALSSAPSSLSPSRYSTGPTVETLDTSLALLFFFLASFFFAARSDASRSRRSSSINSFAIKSASSIARFLSRARVSSSYAFASANCAPGTRISVPSPSSVRFTTNTGGHWLVSTLRMIPLLTPPPSGALAP
mmetsp:Transcript_1708/g.5431  ORF Transcript_1708/g.5431 Transcript_1708/m.5431 type:complete len:203 (-) Transcript_1708:267-875(-)